MGAVSTPLRIAVAEPGRGRHLLPAVREGDVEHDDPGEHQDHEHGEHQEPHVFTLARHPRPPSKRLTRGAVLQRPPAAGPVVGDQAPEELQQRLLGDDVALAERDRPGRLVLVPGGDQAVRGRARSRRRRRRRSRGLGRRGTPRRCRRGRSRAGPTRLIVSVISGSARCSTSRTRCSVSRCQSGSGVEVVVDARVAGAHRVSARTASAARRTTSGRGVDGRAGSVLST